MSFSGFLGHGVQPEQSSTDVLALTITTNNVAAGRTLWIPVAIDSGTGGAGGSATDRISIEDSQGNVYEKDGEYRYQLTAGNNSGAIVALFRGEITTELVAGTDTVTIHLTAAVTAKVLGAFSYAKAGSVQLVDVVMTGGQSTTPSVASNAVPSAEYLCVGVLAWEYNTTGMTLDADYTTRVNTNSGGAADTTSVTLVCQTRIATLTGDTFNLSDSPGTDWAILLAIYEDVSAGNEGSGTATLPSLGTGGTGVVRRVATGALTLAALQLFGTGSVSRAGTGALTLPAVELAGTGTVSRVGTGALALPGLQLSGIGEDSHIGSGALTFAPLTLSGTGSVARVGSGVLTLPAVELAGTGKVSRIGTGSLTLPAVELAGTGTVSRVATAALMLPALELSGTGKVSRVGSGTLALAPLTLSGTGSLTRPGSGTLTLPALALAGTGSVQRIGAGALALGGLEATGTGAVLVTGGDLTLPALELVGAGIVRRIGSGTLVLPGLQLVGTSPVFDAPFCADLDIVPALDADLDIVPALSATLTTEPALSASIEIEVCP
jgi:hypothetical protein